MSGLINSIDNLFKSGHLYSMNGYNADRKESVIVIALRNHSDFVVVHSNRADYKLGSFISINEPIVNDLQEYIGDLTLNNVTR